MDKVTELYVMLGKQEVERQCWKKLASMRNKMLLRAIYSADSSDSVADIRNSVEEKLPTPENIRTEVLNHLLR